MQGPGSRLHEKGGTHFHFNCTTSTTHKAALPRITWAGSPLFLDFVAVWRSCCPVLTTGNSPTDTYQFSCKGAVGAAKASDDAAYSLFLADLGRQARETLLALIWLWITCTSLQLWDQDYSYTEAERSIPLHPTAYLSAPT